MHEEVGRGLKGSSRGFGHSLGSKTVSRWSLIDRIAGGSCPISWSNSLIRFAYSLNVGRLKFLFARLSATFTTSFSKVGRPKRFALSGLGAGSSRLSVAELKFGNTDSGWRASPLPDVSASVGNGGGSLCAEPPWGDRGADSLSPLLAGLVAGAICSGWRSSLMPATSAALGAGGSCAAPMATAKSYVDKTAWQIRSVPFGTQVQSRPPNIRHAPDTSAKF